MSLFIDKRATNHVFSSLLPPCHSNAKGNQWACGKLKGGKSGAGRVSVTVSVTVAIPIAQETALISNSQESKSIEREGFE